MFFGQHRHRVDDKLRVTLPHRFRPELDEKVVLTRGPEHCIWVFPWNAWVKLSDELASYPWSQKDSRLASRLMFSNAFDTEPDGQGRVRVPEPLAQYAGLEPRSEVVVVGMRSWLEIWPAERWEEHEAMLEEQAEEITERLHNLGQA